MNTEYKDFIGVYQNVYPEGYCEHLIEQFEYYVQSGAAMNRRQSESTPKDRKDDLQLELNFAHTRTSFNGHGTVRFFFEGLQKCYDHYTEEYSILRHEKIRAVHMKMQRTDPGGGYHIWHAEQGRHESSSRVLVYMLYLNTLLPEEAGETEFLYQQRRINPQENTMIIWPAAYTHTHRGNVVHGTKSKYVITGWFNYE